jgi:acetyltransferase EpsM
MAAVISTSQGAHAGARVNPKALVVVGSGEHALVVVDAARTRPDLWRMAGYTSPTSAGPTTRMSIEHLGDDDTFRARLTATPADDRPTLVLGFGGAPTPRRAVAAAFGTLAEWAVIVHVTAWVSPDAIVGPGSVVLAGAVINHGARVGAHCIVNTSAVIEHDVVIGAGTHVAPGVVIGGGTQVGEDTAIGLGAAIRDHITVGDRAIVGMGAVVVEDVADDIMVLGVPARERGAAI